MLRLAVSLIIASVFTLPQVIAANSNEAQMWVNRGPEDEAHRKARLRTSAMQQAIADLRLLPPEQRHQQAAGMGLKLERHAKQVAGTRYENQAVFWLAEWHLEHRPVAEAEALLDRLETLTYSGLKQTGRLLRIRCLIRSGNLEQARRKAELLVQKLPEASATLNLIAFLQQVGKPAPALHGRNLTGGNSNPLTARAEPWLLCAFFSPGDADQLWHVRQLLTEIADPAYVGRIGVVLVAMDGDPLQTMGLAQQLPNGANNELLWLSPHDGSRTTITTDWQLPALPALALLGPDRSFMALNPTANDLRPIAGKATTSDYAEKSPSRPKGGGLGWRGKR